MCAGNEFQIDGEACCIISIHVLCMASYMKSVLLLHDCESVIQSVIFIVALITKVH